MALHTFKQAICGCLLLNIWLALVPATVSAAAPTGDIWMTVLLQGRKIGSMHEQRNITDGKVRTLQTLKLALDRGGVPLKLGSQESSLETIAGKPLRFTSITDLSSARHEVHGQRLPDGRFRVTTTLAGAGSSREIAWPSGALLTEGERLAQLKAGLQAGAHVRFLGYDPDSGQALPVDSEVIGREHVELPGGARMLTHIQQSTVLPDGSSTPTQMWVDEDYRVHKLMLPLLGQRLEMLACSRACAGAPEQSIDLLQQTAAPVPRKLSAAERAQPLEFDVNSTRGDTPLSFASTDEQSVRRSGNTWHIHIGGTAVRREPPPAAADLAANEWLQSDAPAVRKLAARAAGTGDTATRMQHLQTFVRGYIRSKDLGVGYASALETLGTREGDCTEHAVLLAALARAQKIPARVVTGLAYVPEFAGIHHALVPHAWAQAWVDGHWRGYDAALDGFDSGHIAIGVGDGDPWKFYAGLNTLGRMQVSRVRIATP